jgi:hypothetical protein
MPRPAVPALFLLLAAACSADSDQLLAPPLMPEIAGDASPHFVRTSAEGPDQFGNVELAWKEAGLGVGVLIEYLATAKAKALYACQNSGGNFPGDSKKQEVVVPVSAETGFDSDRNGEIAGRVTLFPPDPVSPPEPCASGQTLVLVQARYTDIVIADVTNGIRESVPGTFCRTLFDNALPPDPC